MNGNLTFWICGLLFAALVAVSGMSMLICARRADDRNLASGLMSQGIVLMFVVAGAYHRSSLTLSLGGLVVVIALIVQSLCSPDAVECDTQLNETTNS